MESLDPKDLQPQTMLGMKLIQQPFSKIPDAENLFDFDALKQTRDTVSHHLQFSHLLMVVQGRKGSGKNSFANSLIVSEHPALYFFNATAEADDTLRDILNKAAINNHADDISVLEKRIGDIMYRGQQPVFIINDAEQLNENELRELIEYSQSKKDTNQQTQLKLLLLGDHQLEKKLEKNGIINHNQFYLIDLPQLNVSNTRAFLTHRLSLAGFRDTIPFSDKDINNIYNMANGNPVATMEYAAESLNNNKSLYAEDFSTAKKTKTTLIITGAVLFAAAFIYNSLLTPDTDKESSEKIELPLNKTAEKKAIDQLFKSSSNTMDVKQEKNLNIGNNLSLNKSLAELDDSDTIQSPADRETLAAIADSSRSEKTDMPSPEQIINVFKDEIKTETIIKPVIKASSGIPVPADSANNSSATIKSSVNEEPVDQAKNTSKTETKAVIEPVTKTKKPVDSVTRSFTNAGVHSPDWLLEQPSGNWSLQILGAYKPETLLSYVHQHRLGSKVSYFRTRLGSKDWHVILYGQYASKEKAKAVIPYLPEYIRQNNPWPKDMKSTQKAIKQQQKLQN